MIASDAIFDQPPPMEDDGETVEPIARIASNGLTAPSADALTALESERVVLSRVLRSSPDLAFAQRLVGLVGEEDFSLPAHRAIAHVTSCLLEGGHCPSPTAVLASAKAKGRDDGGVEYLAQLVADPVWARADEAVVLADAANGGTKARAAGFEPIYLARWRHLAVAASKRSSAAL